ncbi:hypothetical protein BGW42_002881 [Actinomortierella wolfii]|nr:hypothetical protein BGW42_002881 [Actinomortierella wolfii]
MKLHRRNHSWAEDYSMLFIDQPVGTGYSYVTHKNETNEMLRQKLTDLLEQEQEEESTRHQQFTPPTKNNGVPMQQDTMSISGLGGGQFIGAETSGRQGGVGPIYFYGYTKDQRGVADDLMVFLHEFYRRYPEQRASDLYITGESYAGKYVPTFADAIVRYNKDLEQEQQQQQMQQDGNRNRKGPIRLQGIALGNSLTDPVSQVQAHGNLAFYLGYLDWQQQEAMLQAQQDSVEAAKRFRFLDSNRHRNDVFKLFTAATGGINWYDVRKGLVPNNWTLMEQFMNLDMVKDSLNVYGPRISLLKQWACTDDEIQYVVDCRNEIRYEKDLLVREVMASDIMRTSAPIVGRLLDQGVKVLAYQGVFDYRDGVAGSHYWIDHLPWHGQEQFRQQPRKLWMLDHSADGHGSQRLAGYITQYDRLSKVAVLGAGHLAPMDQALSMQLLIRSFIDSETLHLKESHHEVSKHHTI